VSLERRETRKKVERTKRRRGRTGTRQSKNSLVVVGLLRLRRQRLRQSLRPVLRAPQQGAHVKDSQELSKMIAGVETGGIPTCELRWRGLEKRKDPRRNKMERGLSMRSCLQGPYCKDPAASCKARAGHPSDAMACALRPRVTNSDATREKRCLNESNIFHYTGRRTATLPDPAQRTKLRRAHVSVAFVARPQ
jgi:hypothetical protein